MHGCGVCLVSISDTNWPHRRRRLTAHGHPNHACARTLLVHASGAMPQTAEELKAAGNAAYAAGDNAKALECYEQALEVAGADLRHILHSNASAAALRLRQADAALQHARQCIELSPSFAKGYGRLAAAAHAAHRPGDAEAALRRGLQACPAGEAAALRQELDRLLKASGAGHAAGRFCRPVGWRWR